MWLNSITYGVAPHFKVDSAVACACKYFKQFL